MYHKSLLNVHLPKMRLLKKHSVFVLCLLIIYSHALSCRSKHGPKDEELKRIFNDCIKQQEGNSSNNPYTSEPDRMERSYNHKNDYGRNTRNDERNNDKDNVRDDYGNDRSNGRNGREQVNNSKRTENDKNNEDRRNNRMSSSNGMEPGSRGRNEMKRNHNTHLNGQDDFLQSEEYGNRNYYSSPQPNMRYKREKKVEMNSGQRSQYNPHSQRSNENKENQSNEGNSSDNSSKVACVLHCFLENQQMTGDDGMPDRYLITHVLTKDERNEDLRDFLQESIEECFQILDNENTEDKCEFSKNLWICLSEKGKANCDDWPKHTSFMF